MTLRNATVSWVRVAALLVAVIITIVRWDRPLTASPQNEVTFTKDIAPILQRSCQKCHRPDSVAPMSFLTYEQVRPYARAIKQQTELRQMPPWYIDKTIGIQKFLDD